MTRTSSRTRLSSVWIRLIQSGDAWEASDGNSMLHLRPHLEMELWGRIGKFLFENRADAQRCARYDQGRGSPQAAPKIPADLQWDPANWITNATEAFLAAFGNERIGELLSDLQLLHLSDQLIARLLRSLEGSWRNIPDFMQARIGSKEWLAKYRPPPASENASNQNPPRRSE